MYRGRLWTMRQYAGFGTAAESNARYRYLLAQGVSGLSVAFDLPTQMGYDSDHPLAAGEVGRVGVAIDSIEDMAALFDGIPLDRVSTSMTINATAIILLALYVAVARRQGVAARAAVGHGPERHPEGVRRARHLHLSAARRRCGSSPTSSRSASASCRTGTRSRSAAITSARPARRRCRRWRSPSPTRIAYVQAALDAGLDVNQFGQRLSFFFNAHNNFLEEIAKFRAARRLWARIMRDRFGATNPRAQQLRFHTQTAGSTLTAQQPDNNIVRVALQALAAVLGGTQSLHCNGRDEALALPTEESARIALRTQQIIAAESGVANTVDPVGGSYAIEALTDDIERGRRGDCSTRIDAAGRHAGGDRDRASSSARSRTPPTARSRPSTPATPVVVGVNRFARTAAPRASADAASVQRRSGGRAPPDRARPRGPRQPRAPARGGRRSRAVADAARDGSNLVPPIIAAVEAQRDRRRDRRRDADGLRRVRGDRAVRLVSDSPLLDVSTPHDRLRSRRGGPVAAVDDVSFEIRAGETLGLVGESGSGKSVTALSIMRLVQPPGRIAGGTHPLQGPRPADAAASARCATVRGAEIALIFQEPMTALNPVFTIGDQIAETLLVHGRATRRDGQGRAIELLDAVRIPDAASRVRRLPAPAVRRHAAARADRDGARLPAVAASSPTSRRRRSTSRFRRRFSTCCAR